MYVPVTAGLRDVAVVADDKRAVKACGKRGLKSTGSRVWKLAIRAASHARYGGCAGESSAPHLAETRRWQPTLVMPQGGVGAWAGQVDSATDLVAGAREATSAGTLYGQRRPAV